MLMLSGKRIEAIAKALGMAVIVSERKGASSFCHQTWSNRVL
jgi:hypothetical protein